MRPGMRSGFMSRPFSFLKFSFRKFLSTLSTSVYRPTCSLSYLPGTVSVTSANAVRVALRLAGFRFHLRRRNWPTRKAARPAGKCALCGLNRRVFGGGEREVELPDLVQSEHIRAGIRGTGRRPEKEDAHGRDPESF